jgi:hypothetical protein
MWEKSRGVNTVPSESIYEGLGQFHFNSTSNPIRKMWNHQLSHLKCKLTPSLLKYQMEKQQ